MAAAPTVAVAVSGGLDSLALLHATRRAAAANGVRVVALHVHHGLQGAADDWAARVQATCRRWRLDCLVERLRGAPARGDSIEAWARRERYAALARLARQAGATLVLLAHHRRDQAETFLLQALRGAGAAGLAAMPLAADRDGLRWARPWLAQPRSAIEAYARRHRLKAIDDPSNHDPRYARSRLRTQVWPALAAAFPDADVALAQAAARAAETREALDEIGAKDVAAVADASGLQLGPWQRLPPGRRRVALQRWLALQLGQGAPSTLVDRLLREAAASTTAAQWPCGGGTLHRYRGRLRWQPVAGDTKRAAAATPLSIRRAGRYRIAAGTLVVARVASGGVPLALLQACELRARAGGERFQRAPQTPARRLKKQFQDGAVPAWQRHAPLLYSGDLLVLVPGLGLDARAQAVPGAPRVTVDWQPDR